MFSRLRLLRLLRGPFKDARRLLCFRSIGAAAVSWFVLAAPLRMSGISAEPRR